MKGETTLLGYCGVDSGQILLVDPCYVENGLDYNDACCSHDVGCDHTKDHEWHTHQTYHQGYGGQVQSIKGDGVVVGSFGGDGVFPVYARIVDVNGCKMVQSVEIVFMTQEDLDYYKETNNGESNDDLDIEDEPI